MPQLKPSLLDYRGHLVNLLDLVFAYLAKVWYGWSLIYCNKLLPNFSHLQLHRTCPAHLPPNLFHPQIFEGNALLLPLPHPLGPGWCSCCSNTGAPPRTRVPTPLSSPFPMALGSPSIGFTASLCGELLSLIPWTPEHGAQSIF